MIKSIHSLVQRNNSQVQPRSRKRINNTGMGTPNNQSNAHPIFPSLRTLRPMSFILACSFLLRLLLDFVAGFFHVFSESVSGPATGKGEHRACDQQNGEKCLNHNIVRGLSFCL